MIKFSKEKVLLLHRLIAEETGGSIGVRYETLLESALENVFSGFGGQEFYPTREEKGARLGYALISNHAFVDGNKRIGMYVMLTFLEVNGIRLDCAVWLSPPAQWTTRRCWRGCGRTVSDPVLTQNGIGVGRAGRKQRKIRRTCVKTQQVDIYYKFIGLINQKAEGGYKGEVVKVKRTEIENQPA